MTATRRLVFFLVAMVIIQATQGRSMKNKKKPKLLFVLLDGMRWDNFGLDLPHLDSIEKTGVKADWMDPVFATMSLPSMYSMATGLYPESHGVIHNLYYDPENNTITKSYEESLNKTEVFNTGVDPIWVTAKRHGLNVSSIFYPGTHVPINGIKPDKSVPITRWFYFNYPKKDRIDDTIRWLSEDDYDLSMLYFVDPDAPLHVYGIKNETSTYVNHQLDHYIGYLLSQITEKKLWDVLNVIIVSDHGHTDVNETNKIEIYDYINETDVDVVIGNYGPTFQLKPKEGKFEKVYNSLKNVHPHLHVFKKEDIPERFHYGNHPRIFPIFGYTDPTWAVYTRYDPQIAVKSDHGYDNEEMDMKSIFYAQGPFFKKGYRAKPLESVDLYEMMCEILDLEPAPNNGSKARYADMKYILDYTMSTPIKYEHDNGSSRTLSQLTLIWGILLCVLPIQFRR